MNPTLKDITVAFDAKRAFCNTTGLGNYTRTFIKGVLGCPFEGKLKLFTPKINDVTFNELMKKDERVQIITPQSKWARGLSSLWRSVYNPHLKNLKARTDIYHGPSHELPYYYKTISKDQRPTLVVTIHDVIYLKYPQFFNFIDRQVYHYKWKLSCQMADHIIAISEQTKKDLIELLHVPAQKIHVIHQAIDESFYQPISEQLKQKTKERYRLNGPFILYVGHFNERKNIHQLIKAYSQSKAKEHWPLVLVGQGDQYQQKCLKLVEDLNLKEQVRFARKVSFRELISLYHLAEVFAYPSLYEGFGLPLVEAQAQNTAVITSKDCGLDDAGGPHSIYINPQDPQEIANKIDELVFNETYREELKVKGLKFAQYFHPEQVAPRTFEFYQKISF